MSEDDDLEVYARISNVDDASLVSELSLAFSSDNMVHSQFDLQDFIRLKSSPNLNDRFKAIRFYGPKMLGNENWVIGLVGMLYDREQSDLALYKDIALKAIPLLTEEPIFLSVSLLKALYARLSDLRSVRKPLLKTLKSPLFSAYVVRHQDDMLGQELRQLALLILGIIGEDLDKDSFLERVGMQPQTRLRPRAHLPSSVSVSSAEPFVSESESVSEKVFLPSLNKRQKTMMLATLETAEVVLSRDVFPVMQENFALMLGAITLLQSETIVFSSQSSHSSDSHDVAVLTDFPFEVSSAFSTHCFVVKQDPLNRIRTFSDQFEKLFSQHYRHILVLFPSVRLWSSSYFATQAAAGALNREIMIIETDTYGLGFRLLLQDLLAVLMERQEFIFLHQRLLHQMARLRYWVVVEDALPLEDVSWYQTLLRLYSPSVSVISPLLAFHSPMTLLKGCQSVGTACDVLRGYVQDYVNETVSAPTQFLVGYSGLFEEAEQLLLFLRRLFPAANIMLELADEHAIKTLGNHIGVALL